MTLLPTLIATSLLLAQSSSNISIENNINTTSVNVSSETKSNSSVTVNTQSDSNTRVEIVNDRFEIEGKVTLVSNNYFTVDGQAISLDGDRVASYKQNGTLVAGNRVLVKGSSTNNVLYAETVQSLQGNSDVVNNENPGNSDSTNPTDIPPATDTEEPETSRPMPGFWERLLTRIQDFFSSLFK